MEGWVSSRFSRDVPPIQIVFLIYDMGKRYSLRGNDCLVFRARFVDNHFAPDLDPALHTGIVAEGSRASRSSKCIDERPVQANAPAVQL